MTAWCCSPFLSSSFTSSRERQEPIFFFVFGDLFRSIYLANSFSLSLVTLASCWLWDPWGGTWTIATLAISSFPQCVVLSLSSL
jgi:hypothetical protein